MHFEPDRPMYDRYQVDHDFLSAETGDEVVTISRLVNAFFRWEFNSCETIVDGVASPIDYANAGRRADEPALLLPLGDPGARPLDGVLLRHRAADADQPDDAGLLRDRRPRRPLYEEKLGEYRRLADDYFQVRVRRVLRQKPAPGRDPRRLGRGAGFDGLLVDTVTSTFPPHEHEHFVAHYRGLLAAWAKDQRRPRDRVRPRAHAGRPGPARGGVRVLRRRPQPRADHAAVAPVPDRRRAGRARRGPGSATG